MISIVVALIFQQDSKVCILKLVIYAGQISLCHAKIEKILIKIFVMINKDGGWTIFRFYKGDIELMGVFPAPPPPPPTNENPERCQDKNEGSLFLKQELKFFSQIYQGQA